MNRPPFDESKQIALAQEDIRHFAPLYNWYYHPVFRFIHARIERAEDAADLCASVFIKAMDKLSTYEDRGFALLSWLLRIASNEVNLFYRSRKTHQKYFIEQKHLQKLSEEMAEADEQMALLNNCLEMLSPEEYELIQMKYFEGMGFSEIAVISGKSEESLRVQMHRLRKRMKGMLVELSKKKGIELVLALSVLLVNIL